MSTAARSQLLFRMVVLVRGYNYPFGFDGDPHSQGSRHVRLYKRKTFGIVIDSSEPYFIAFDFLFGIFCKSIYEFLRDLPCRKFWPALRLAFEVSLSFGLSAEFCSVLNPECELPFAWIFEYRGIVNRGIVEFLHLVLYIISDSKFLPMLTQGLHLAVLERRSRCMNGHHACTAMSFIPQLPGCVAWMASWILVGIGMTIRSSTQTQLVFTCRSFQ